MCSLLFLFLFLFLFSGSGYFDVRAKDERWVRIKMGKGDMITLPAGMYHRFTLDDTNYIKVRDEGARVSRRSWPVPTK